MCHCLAPRHLGAELLQHAVGWNAGAPATAGGVDNGDVGDELLDRRGVELPKRASTGRAR